MNGSAGGSAGDLCRSSPSIHRLAVIQHVDDGEVVMCVIAVSKLSLTDLDFLKSLTGKAPEDDLTDSELERLESLEKLGTPVKNFATTFGTNRCRIYSIEAFCILFHYS